MSGGRSPKQKGNRAEYMVRDKFREVGFGCERVPLSGAAKQLPGDLSLPLLGKDLVGEVKCRKAGFQQLYNWLENRDFLVVKQDRKEALVVVPIDLFRKIAWTAEANKNDPKVAIYDVFKQYIEELVGDLEEA